MSGVSFELGNREAVFGMFLRGGPLGGAMIRDIRLANELSRRGYRVHAWWAIDRPQHCDLRPEIEQHWLFSGLRYASLPWESPRGLKDALGRLASGVCPHNFWVSQAQRRPGTVRALMRALIRRTCEGVDSDVGLVRRLSRELTSAGVTHVLPTMEIFAAWALAARERAQHRFGVLMTFQGYELMVNHVRGCADHDRLVRRLREMAEQSDWPAVVVSEAYRRRVMAELGIPASSLRVIWPGIPRSESLKRADAEAMVGRILPGYSPDKPLVTFVGRRDAEKGIDLLLYAAALLRQQSVDAQYAVVGPTSCGISYVEACKSIADHLRLDVLWAGETSGEELRALYAASRVVVYPPIHGEPFGMVPVEAMGEGTPAVVPDDGGVSEVIDGNGVTGGLRFRTHDTRSLADAIGKLLTDKALWQKLSQAGPKVAEAYSVERMAGAILEHVGLAAQGIGC